LAVAAGGAVGTSALPAGVGSIVGGTLALGGVVEASAADASAVDAGEAVVRIAAIAAIPCAGT
jgi:hypothetical protein